MASCSRCGNPITFRYVDGRCVPLHLHGGCIDGGNSSSSTDYSGYSCSEESCCFLTSCPECGDDVFFIRSNGGSVWIDPPLGPPWYKHPCMDQGGIISGRSRSSLLFADPSEYEGIEDGRVLGVVKESEVSLSKKCTITCIETEKNDRYVLLVKFNAGYLTGNLVIYNPKLKTVNPFKNPGYTYDVVVVLSTPHGIEGQDEQVSCPECNVILNSKNANEHMKNQHWFRTLRNATANK